MAKALALSLCLLLVLNGCLAARQQYSHDHQQKTDCQIDGLQARESKYRVEAEAGLIESWDYTPNYFRCAGVAADRITIHRDGLHLPHFSNAPQLIYVLQGRGVLGTVFSGCPETFEESQQQQEGQQKQFEQLDRHQMFRIIREGDVIAIPAGVAYWSYNDGDESLVAVSLLHVSSDSNQLDQNPRRFYLAGNPEDEFGQQKGQSQHGQQQQEGNGYNVFSGFSTQLLAQALNIDEETARNLQGQNERRNQIVRVRGRLHFVQPPRARHEREHEEQLEEEREHARQQGGGKVVNGLEEINFCSARLKENIADPERADVYSPGAGRISRLNSYSLPILRSLRLSAERGFFYKNAIYTPHWNVNAHSVVYVIRGSARVQVVSHGGTTILDDQVHEGQLFIVPQGDPVISQAGNEGFQYIAFKTDDNVVINTMAGRTSFLQGLPEEVLSNACQISRDQARRLKYNRQETTALSSSQRAIA